MPPQWSNLPLAAYVPYGEADILVFHSFYVKACKKKKKITTSIIFATSSKPQRKYSANHPTVKQTELNNPRNTAKSQLKLVGGDLGERLIQCDLVTILRLS